MNKLFEMLLIGAVKAKLPGVAKQYERYEMYAVPLIRARRYYGHNRKKGMDTKDALKAAAYDAKVPLHLLTDYMKDKTGDFGEASIASLQGTSFSSDKGFQMKP